MDVAKKTPNALNKLDFFKLLGYTPHKGQVQMHCDQARYRTMVCGVRWGKSLSAAMELLAAMRIQDSRYWVVAPTLELTEKVFRELHSKAVNSPLCKYIASESYRMKELSFVWGSEVKGKTADNPISLAGEALNGLVVDEAPGCKEEVWTYYLRQRLTDRHGWALFIGTPKGMDWVSHLFKRGQDPLYKDYSSYHFTSYDNPYLLKSEIDEARNELPDRAFRQEYLAEFLTDQDSVFRNIREQIRDTLRGPQPGKTYIAGVDLAKYQDYNVVCIADCETKELVYFDRWNRTDWSVTYTRIQKALELYNNCKAYVDSTGVGDPIYETLSKPPYSLRVEPFKFTNASKEALIDNLVWFFENSNIFIPDIPELINELEIFEYVKTSSGNIRFNAPSGYHDDIVIGLALAYWGLRTKKQTFFTSLDLSKL